MHTKTNNRLIIGRCRLSNGRYRLSVDNRCTSSSWYSTLVLRCPEVRRFVMKIQEILQKFQKKYPQHSLSDDPSRSFSEKTLMTLNLFTHCRVMSAKCYMLQRVATLPFWSSRRLQLKKYNFFLFFNTLFLYTFVVLTGSTSWKMSCNCAEFWFFTGVLGKKCLLEREACCHSNVLIVGVCVTTPHQSVIHLCCRASYFVDFCETSVLWMARANWIGRAVALSLCGEFLYIIIIVTKEKD